MIPDAAGTIPLTSGAPFHPPEGAEGDDAEAQARADLLLSRARYLAEAEACALLENGEIELEGRLAWGSNETLLCRLLAGEQRAHAVYKPRSGEEPLWDFPRGSLCRREAAAYELSQALGWRFVPPTRLRQGPLGLGVVQLWIPHDPQEHYLQMREIDPLVTRRIAVFDLLINNADRKSGHVLRSPDGRLWAIDHGVAFHVEPKLRTVIWDYAGETLSPEICADIAGLLDGLDAGEPAHAAIAPLLEPAEVEALSARAEALLADPAFPAPDESRRHYPWPPV